MGRHTGAVTFSGVSQLPGESRTKLLSNRFWRSFGGRKREPCGDALTTQWVVAEVAVSAWSR